MTGFEDFLRASIEIPTCGKSNELLLNEYKQINDLIKILEAKKEAIRDNVHYGGYDSGETHFTVYRNTVSTIEVKKAFSFLLRKGMMKAFLSSVMLPKKRLLENGVSEDMIKKFSVDGRSYKCIRIKE